MKKYLEFVLTFMIALAGLTVPCFAEESPLSDIEGTKYEQSAKLLYDMGIIAGYEDGTFKPEREVSRGELCAMIARAINMADWPASDRSMFTDTENSPYRTYIEALAGMNIVHGMGDGTFQPNASVLTEQVVKIAVGAIDYDAFLTSENYPDNYMNVASANGLLKNVSSPQGKAMTRGEIAILIENMLSADAVKIEYGAKRNVSFSDETVMSKVLNIDEYYGTMTANENANLVGNKLPGTGIVTITTSDGDITANSGVLDINADLGKKGRFYIKNAGDDDAEVIHFRESQNGNKTLDIDADSFDSVEISNYGENIKITYYVNNNRKNVKLAAGSRIFLNGKQVEPQNVTEDMFDIDNGNITLVAVDDNDYDTVFITNYVDFVVSSVRLEDYKIFVKPNSNTLNGDSVQYIVLDPDDQYQTYTLKMDNEDIELEDLQALDVLTVMSTEDGSVMDVTVSRKIVEGSVSSTGENDGEDYCKIDGNTYLLSDDINETIKVGDEGTFYLDIFDRIVYVDTNLNTKTPYGYLMKSYPEENGEDYALRILTQNGETDDFPVKSKVRLNDSSVSAEEMVASLGNTGALIRYSTDSDGKITKIYTAVDNGSSDYIGYDSNTFSKDSNTADGSMYFKNTAIPGFNGRYMIGEDTIIFIVPANATDYDNYRVAKSSYFVNDLYYNVDIYDADRAMIAGVVVSKGIDETKSDEESLSWNAPIMLIDEVREEYDDGDELSWIVHGLRNGEEVAVKVAEENADGGEVISDACGDWQGVDPSTLERGSVIQYKTNIDGELDEFRILFVPGASMRITNLDANSNHKIECQTVVGLVDVCRDGIIKVTLNGGASYNAATGKTFAVGNANIYCYDTTGKKTKIENAVIEDILSRENVGDSASKVFIRANKETVGDIVIYK